MMSSVMLFFENLRIEIEQPSIASGGAMILTRLPSSSRASQIGQVSSTRRPIASNDPLRNVHDVLIVTKLYVGEFELALTLDVYLVEAVHHDVGDGLVAQQRLERPEADHVVDDGRSETSCSRPCRLRRCSATTSPISSRIWRLSSSRGSLVAAVASIRS